MFPSVSRFSLYKRPSGIYYIGYYRNGRRCWKSTRVSTKPEALKVLTLFRELSRDPTRNLSLRDFVSEFLTYSGINHAKKTTGLFRSSLESFSRLVGSAMLGEVTPEHVDRYKTKRLREVSPVSVNVELRMLRSAFSTAKRWKLLASNPLDGVRFADVPEQAPVFLTPQEFQTLIGCIQEGWFRDLVIFASLTGMRKGEILNLRWSDVDPVRKVVHIQTGPSFKTKAGRRRTNPLSDPTFHLLAARQGKSTSEYVFTQNDAQINAGWVSHLFKRYVRLAHLNERLHYHSLRHSFASWLVQGGATLYEVQRLLGHSSPKVTEAYAHLQPDQMHETVNRIKVALN